MCTVLNTLFGCSKKSSLERSVVKIAQEDVNSIEDVDDANNAHKSSTVLASLTENIRVKYMFGSMLGRGAYGTVLACMEKSTRRVHACKIIKPSVLLRTADGPNAIGRLQNEIASMSYLAGHPNIIRLVDVYETKAELFVVQEMCRGGNLMQLLEQNHALVESDAATLFRGMIKAVLHCHQLGIVHRDIKLENFLLTTRFTLTKQTDAVLKLADFGLSCFHRNEVMVEAVGSAYYMAPEMVKLRQYGVQADVWSCGVCLYRMLIGKYPFDGTTAMDIFDQLKNNPTVDFSSRACRALSGDSKELIGMLLTADPGARISGQDVLRHPWMVSNQELKTLRRQSTTTLDTFSYDPYEAVAVVSPVKDVIQTKAVLGQTPSARIFFLPSDISLRTKIHTFIDMFKKNIEEPYVKLLRADSGDDAAVEWGVMCTGLARMNEYMECHASNTGFLFLGRDPSLAEAAIAPSLYRMCATLPVIRDLDLIKACQELSLSRLYVWLKEVLDRPADCCDVLALPKHVYVHLARRLYVKYEGPPTPPTPPTPPLQQETT